METVGPFTEGERRTYWLTCDGADFSATDLVYVWRRAGANSPPTANAGPDRDVASASRVELEAHRSTDDYSISSAVWTQTAGPPVTLGEGYSQLNASFVAPIVTSNTVFTFSLVVTDDEGAASAADVVNITVLPIPPTVEITGAVQYQYIPAGPAQRGLRYADQEYVQISDILVEVLNARTQEVITSGVFWGDFRFTVPSQTELVLRATARTSRDLTPDRPLGWQVSVRDLDSSGAPIGDVYSYVGPTFDSGPGGRFLLQIPSGWSTSGQLIGPRHAAPFAILKSIRTGLDRVAGEWPRIALPDLVVDWSPANEGGMTYYTRDSAGAHRIVLSGEVDVDTDEYDMSVILHEFGHFVLSAVSRDESLGGAHGYADRLDMRVAFSEGFATAFAAYAGGAEIRDTFGPGQADAGYFIVNSDTPLNEGWYNEFSVHELLYRFGDFGAVWDVITTSLRQTEASTTLFPVFTALKQVRPSQADSIVSMLEGERITGATINDYGSTETNDAGAPDTLPIYRAIALGDSVRVTSSNLFGTGNKLGNHRYLRLSLSAAANVRFQVVAEAGRDPDIEIFRQGLRLAPRQGPANEDFSLMLDSGEYVLDVYDCGNAGCNDGVAPGATSITVTVTSN